MGAGRCSQRLLPLGEARLPGGDLGPLRCLRDLSSPAAQTGAAPCPGSGRLRPLGCMAGVRIHPPTEAPGPQAWPVGTQREGGGERAKGRWSVRLSRPCPSSCALCHVPATATSEAVLSSKPLLSLLEPNTFPLKFRPETRRWARRLVAKWTASLRGSVQADPPRHPSLFVSPADGTATHGDGN